MPLPRRIAAVLLTLLLGAACAAGASPAWADTRGTDVVCGKTVEERGLTAEELPDITAPRAIVVDRDGTVYFERNADEQSKIASITKVMTAIVALENASLTDTVTVDHAAATVGESTSDLKEGDTLAMEQALRALLIPSGNDAAMAIAATVGPMIDPETDDALATFVAAMNAKSQELGLQAVFTNPHGLDFNGWEGDMHASARDVATMFAYAMRNDDFRALTASDDNKITVTDKDGEKREIEMVERNLILGQDGNIGGKTGGTYEALQCFVGAFSIDGNELYTVVLGCETGEERFDDTLALSRWYYANKVTIPVTDTDKRTVEGGPLIARVAHTDWTDKTVDVTLAEPDATMTLFIPQGPLEQEISCSDVSGSVHEGDELGTLTVTQDGTELAQVALVAAEDVEEPSPIEWLLVQFDRFVRMIEGKPASAESEIIATAPAPEPQTATGE